MFAGPLHTVSISGPLTCRDGDDNGALSKANEAANHYNTITHTDWGILGNSESKYFKPLIPIGYQFKADMLNTLHSDPDSNVPDLTLDTVLDAYSLALNTPPLNESRWFHTFLLNYMYTHVYVYKHFLFENPFIMRLVCDCY